MLSSGTHGNHVTGDVTHSSSPALGRVIQNIVYSNAAVILGQGVKIFLEENVLSGHIGKNEVDLGLVTVSTTTDNGTDNLKHRSDASATSNHAEVADHIRSVDKGALGTSDTDGLADDERRHVLGNVTLRIRFDQEIEITGLVIARDGSI